MTPNPVLQIGGARPRTVDAALWRDRGNLSASVDLEPSELGRGQRRLHRQHAQTSGQPPTSVPLHQDACGRRDLATKIR